MRVRPGDSSVPLDEPGWWYDEPTPAVARLLRPAGWVVAQLARLRWRLTTPYRASLPVVCVGNFTAGGAGKTPLALAIAQLLANAGERPVFLSRGYGGSEPGPRLIDPRADLASAVGDEPLLLARAAPVVVSRDRAAGARMIEAEVAAGRLAASVIVMDDGMQNPALAKDLTIAVVDGRRGLGNGRVIPAGPLRAPMAMQTALVDLIVLNGATGPAAPGGEIADLARRYPGRMLRAMVAPAEDMRWLEAGPVVAYAGIGNPRRFFDMLPQLGGTVAEVIAFRDHHPLSEADAMRVLTAARRHSATIVTTEKDLARLAGAGGACGELREASRPVPIRLVMPASDEQTLGDMLGAAIARRRH